ncbi:MAG: efflux RND transporter periplasmic adaptor subunit [Roseovarius sp.]
MRPIPLAHARSGADAGTRRPARALSLTVALCLAAALAPRPAEAGDMALTPVMVTEWKPVFGQVDTRIRVPARARIGGTIAELSVTEGDHVEAGAALARIVDEKLDFQIAALDARLDALHSRLATARTDLARGEALIARGVITSQRLDELRTDVRVIEGEISGVEAERAVVRRQIEEGRVLAPESGIVLKVPVSQGSVVTPGEAVAEIGGGGVFLRLAVPERHAADLAEGDRIEIGGADGPRSGILAKLYPLIEGGRVQADVEVEGLDPRFVGRRLPVRLPVGRRPAILVPEGALSHAGGLDFVTVAGPQGPVRRAVVPGARFDRDGRPWREILSGLAAGDVVVTGDD